MSEVLINGFQDDGMGPYMANAWRAWIDEIHKVGTSELADKDHITFMNLWYADTTDPQRISERTMSWKWLVQLAFMNGYQSGFTSRILKGDANE